jgi:hypothetical protein
MEFQSQLLRLRLEFAKSKERKKTQDMEKIVTLKPRIRHVQHKHSDAKLKIIRKNYSCKGISPRKKTKESCSPREIV